MTTREKNKYKHLVTTHHSKNYKSKWNGIPAFMQQYEPQDSLFNHFFLSIFTHIVFFLLLWGLFSVLKIEVINPIFKTKEKVKDIEFTIDSSTKHGYKSKLSKSKSTATTETITNTNKDLSSNTKPNTDLNSNINPNSTMQNKSKLVKKSTKNGFSSIPIAAPDDFSIPMPKFKPASSGSGRLGKKTGTNSSDKFSSNSNSADIGSRDGSLNGSGSAKGTGFDKNATRKAITAYDISPYVNELKRNIRMNWKPAKNSEGQYVELFLRIAKDGRLIILNVKRTSEVGNVDEAALNAVRKTLPLSPLPSKYGKSFLDLIFTFNSGSSSVGSRY